MCKQELASPHCSHVVVPLPGQQEGVLLHARHDIEVFAPCRDAFDHVVDRSLALVAFLKAQGPAAVHNMDNLLLRESMDVIGVARAPANVPDIC